MSFYVACTQVRDCRESRSAAYVLNAKKCYFTRQSLLLHHNHVAVFVQGDAIDLLPRIKCPANRLVDARTFVKIGRRLLALRDIEMHLGL